VQFDDLEILRRVRNKFAHDVDASFDRQDIRNMCAGLKWTVPYASVDPMYAVQVTATRFILTFEVLARNTLRMEEGVGVPVARRAQ
jgi:hypothetical protein